MPRQVLFRSYRAFVLSLPDVTEEFPWGDIAYKTGGKMFAVTGDAKDPFSVTVKVPDADREGLLSLPFAEIARYVGRFGWCTLHVKQPSQLSAAKRWTQVSYDLIAKKARGNRRNGRRAARNAR